MLLQNGFSISLIKKSCIPNQRSADMLIDGEMWEMKAPKGDSRWTIERNMHRAARQSGNIIIDLRRCERPDSKTIPEIKKIFRGLKGLRRVIVISRNSQIIALNKNK